MLKKQDMNYVKNITFKYPKLNRPKFKNLCKANDAKIIHEILNSARSTEPKQKAVEWEVLMLLDPDVASLCKKIVIEANKIIEH